MAAILLLWLLAGCSGDGTPRGDGPAGATGRRNVVLIVLDTVRADRFGCYGSNRGLTPRIDALARRGLLFTRVFSDSGWTLPAHASVFTGLYPVAHRATQETLRLDDHFPTLAEIFSDHGHETFGVSGNPLVSRKNGLSRGFETFIETFRRHVRERHADEGLHPNNVALREFLKETGRERPFFAFMNFIEAHTPYAPPEPFLSRAVGSSFREAEIVEAAATMMPNHYLTPGGLPARRLALLNRLYDGEIAFLDAIVGQLMEILERDGRLDETLVVITSDHGENIGEKGHFGHVFSLHNTLLHVPLILLFPGGAHAGEVRSDTGQLLDLFPTILAWAGISHARRIDGRDLMAPGAERIAKPAIAEYYYPRQVLSVLDPADLRAHRERFLPFMLRTRAVQDESGKLIWTSGGRSELYDISADPGESVDLLAGRPDHPEAKRLMGILSGFVATYQGERPLPPPPPVGWMMPGFEAETDDEELLERLRSLGYVQ